MTVPRVLFLSVTQSKGVKRELRCFLDMCEVKIFDIIKNDFYSNKR